MATVRPTKKQRVLLDFIEQFIAEHGYSPSYREIVNGCGYNSVATVAIHINNLISRGHLRKRDHSARSLELTSSAQEEQAMAADASGLSGDAAGEKWFTGKIEAKLEELEAAPEVSAEAFGTILLLVAALDIMDMGQTTEKLTAKKFAPRVELLKQRMESDGKAV